ncbi:MAG: hypothetical protein FJY53_01405 [Betaproteobacteria bacterium]|nr:hypothetical protein [Betaproteobacteria bacterium]
MAEGDGRVNVKTENEETVAVQSFSVKYVPAPSQRVQRMY